MSIIKKTLLLSLTMFFLFGSASSFAESNKKPDPLAMTKKLNKMMPQLQNRFCRLTLRPDAIIVVLGIYSVEWSIDRLCNSKLPEQ